jgi:ribulose-5-phosphate 4-epimerase/fuculose-1-phosphate aldolase
MHPAEWEQRVDLAACYRLVEHFGWTDLIYTHISARVPGEPGHFLLNRFGLLFDEVTASNLIKVDLDGNVIDDPEAPMHKAGFVIHSAIHGARDDVDCVIHTHSKAGVAVAAMQDGLLPLSQHAQLFYGRATTTTRVRDEIDERSGWSGPRDNPDDPAQPRPARGRTEHPARVQQPVQSAVACETQVLAMAAMRRSTPRLPSRHTASSRPP